MSFLSLRSRALVLQGDMLLFSSRSRSTRSQKPDVRGQLTLLNSASEVGAQFSTTFIGRSEKADGADKQPLTATSLAQKSPIQHRANPRKADAGGHSKTMRGDYHSASADPAVGLIAQNSPIENMEAVAPNVRRPRALQAIFLKPLKRRAAHGVPACDLQIRSYSPRNVEFFGDFALRAAYYLSLPASGPVPLPRITERWTVPRSNFIFKKSQENFERITFRRLIQIQDANTESVEMWLAFLRKHAYYGVGMKANVWQYEKLGVGKSMDISLENLKSSLNPKWAHFGRRKTLETSEKVYELIKNGQLGDLAKAPKSSVS